MKRPLISVVMSVFNGKRYLRQAVDNILDQVGNHFEFIIINDGSSDGSRELLESYRRADSRVRLVHQSKSEDASIRLIAAVGWHERDTLREWMRTTSHCPIASAAKSIS